MDLRKTIAALGLIAIAAVLAAFQINSGHADPARAVFRISYENHAWVFQRTVCEIRADGRILEVEFSNPPDTIVGYHEIGRLGVKEVERMAALLPEIRQYEMSDPRQVMADFGAVTLSGIEDGQPVPLRIWGDWTSARQSDEAATLVRWLGGVFPDLCPSEP